MGTITARWTRTIAESLLNRFSSAYSHIRGSGLTAWPSLSYLCRRESQIILRRLQHHPPRNHPSQHRPHWSHPRPWLQHSFHRPPRFRHWVCLFPLLRRRLALPKSLRPQSRSYPVRLCLPRLGRESPRRQPRMWRSRRRSCPRWSFFRRNPSRRVTSRWKSGRWNWRTATRCLRPHFLPWWRPRMGRPGWHRCLPCTGWSQTRRSGQ